MEPCYYLLSIFILDMCLSPHVVHKGKQKTSVGEAHRDNRMEFDGKNHETQEVMDQVPRRPKLDLNGLWARSLGLPYGPTSPPQWSPALRFIHS